MLKKQNQKGFTIIEVLIVLAIAAVIMLVVFLAVPALQRNSRNNQRASEANLVVSGVNDCLTNRNGNVASCTTAAVRATVDQSTFQQLSTTSAFVVNTTDNTASYDYVASVTSTQGAVIFGVKCDPAAANFLADGTARQFVFIYQTETASGSALRCLGS